jgi:hypothetical protein
MPILTMKIIASLLQMHGPGATIQSDHKGIDALLDDVRGQITEDGVVPRPPEKTDVVFRRGFVRGAAGGFRKGGYAKVGGGFRRGGFVKV